MTDDKTQQCVILWCRRDLRLDDNPALSEALRNADVVIPVFLWAPEEEGQFQPGRYSRWWTKQAVLNFKEHLQLQGARLIIRRTTNSALELEKLAAETGASTVYFNHLYDPISIVRDHDVKQRLTSKGIQCRSFNADLLYEPWEVLDPQTGQPFTTYAGFWNRVLSMPNLPSFPLSPPISMQPAPESVKSDDFFEMDWFASPEQEALSDQLRFKWNPGAAGALEKLDSFLSDRLHVFELDRAKVDRKSTTQLSPWMHMGTISVRYIFYRVCQRQAEWAAEGKDISQSCKDFMQQIGYREYSRYLSFHFPFIHERALLAHLRACPWRIDRACFKAWRHGMTGFPLIDAAMRQLSSTGWCHNRLRVVVSSFLVKNLLLPWQWGLKHFWDTQLDADLETDALGWQYVSGGMCDAHPFSHIIDLDKEAARCDPDGEYVRRWLPTLARLPNTHIHKPWLAPRTLLAGADVELGVNYPWPIISDEEAAANMAQACAVLEQERVRCDPSSPSDAPQKQPYRAPTYPASGILASLTPFAGPGSGSGTEWRLTGSGGQRGPPPSTQVSAGRPPAQLQNAGARRGLPEAGADNGSSASLSFSSQWDQGDMTGQRDVEGQGEASGVPDMGPNSEEVDSIESRPSQSQSRSRSQAYGGSGPPVAPPRTKGSRRHHQGCEEEEGERVEEKRARV